MAVPPTIPTSFVPKQPVEMHPRHTESSGNMFMTVSIVILGLALLGAGGVFGYEAYLAGERDAKKAELEAEEAKVSDATVEGFIRLRNRLTTAQDLLNNHVMTSQLFDELEFRTLENVRFSTFSYEAAEDGTIQVDMEGQARTFNALAAQSASFAEEGSRIRRAIFSSIGTDDKGVVSFMLTANVDPRLITIPSTVPEGWLTAVPQAASDVPAEADATAPASDTSL